MPRAQSNAPNLDYVGLLMVRDQHGPAARNAATPTVNTTTVTAISRHKGANIVVETANEIRELRITSSRSTESRTGLTFHTVRRR